MDSSNTNGAASAIAGAHLVGSVPFADAETVFRQCCTQMPNRLKRVPDGETGSRGIFTYWQFELFGVYPKMMNDFSMNSAMAAKEYTQEVVDEGIAVLEKASLETGYDKAAVESYAVFKRLKDEGVIARETKFQVSLPTAANVIVVVHKPFQERAFAVYEAALFKAMRRIQDGIPHDQLSIQVDLAVDTAYWEGQLYEPWFDNVKEGTVDYITRMIGQVDQDVELGLHNCYGDMEHKHWYEPTSLRAVTDRAVALLDRTPHKITYFHCPVPLSAMPTLDAYLAPLSDLYVALQAHGCELYLGLVHFDDLEGTKARVEAAKKLAPSFGVATECGWGRTPPEQLENIMKITNEVTLPIF